MLEIGNARIIGPDLPLEQQGLMITKSEELVAQGVGEAVQSVVL